MVQVLGASVKSAREGRGIPAREVARRALAGVPADAGPPSARKPGARPFARRKRTAGEEQELDTVRLFLRRVEQTDGPVELDDDELAALAAALEVEPDHLTSELLWVWEDDAEIPTVGGHVFAFTSTDEAKRWRTVLRMLGASSRGAWELRPTTVARLREGPLRPLKLAHELGGDDLVGEAILRDPDEDTVAAAVLLDDLLTGRQPLEDVDPRTVAALARRLPLPRIERRLEAFLEYDMVRVQAAKQRGEDDVAELRRDNAELALGQLRRLAEVMAAAARRVEDQNEQRARALGLA